MFLHDIEKNTVGNKLGQRSDSGNIGPPEKSQISLIDEVYHWVWKKDLRQRSLAWETHDYWVTDIQKSIRRLAYIYTQQLFVIVVITMRLARNDNIVFWLSNILPLYCHFIFVISLSNSWGCSLMVFS